MSKKTPEELAEDARKAKLARIDARISEVSKAICAQMHADTLDEALVVARTFHHMDHLKELDDERRELEFLNVRRGQLVTP